MLQVREDFAVPNFYFYVGVKSIIKYLNYLQLIITEFIQA